ncbi:DUF4238 domain-containing protein [Mesorhizobium opportunistum]|uniref:DUF4238 domain-containing protein n=1 Tax=Mesorhizobium opportunistum TaxID=593909 RepID=UPI003334F880
MAKKNLPGDHHFVPQFLLRNFVDDAGALHVFDRRTPDRGVFNNPPSKVFFERQLYTTIDRDLSKNVDLELAFAHLESIVAPLVARIVEMAKQNRGAALHSSERQLLAIYTYYQWKRVPDNFRQFSSLATFRMDGEKALREYEDRYRPLNDHEKEHFGKDETWRRMLQNVRSDVIAKGNLSIVATIEAMNLNIVTISNPKKAFIISSFPVYKMNHPGKAALSDPNVEMWFPISSDVSLLWTGRGGETIFRSVSDGAAVRYQNQAAAAKSNLIASRSAALTRSLASYAGVKKGTEGSQNSR